MDGATAALKAKLNRLLKEAAQVSVALDRGDGTITGIPHYSVIEMRAHELGQQLSREIQARQMGEPVAGRTATAPCPKCRARCELEFKDRRVTSIDGPVEVQELQGYCRTAAWPFSPDRETLGFDARELTPLLIQRMTFAAVETRSFERAELVMRHVGDQPVSAKTIERVVHDVGWELAERRDADPKTAAAFAQRPESPPDLPS